MQPESTPSTRRSLLVAMLIAGGLNLAFPARGATPSEILAGYRAAAGMAPSAPDRGQQLFTTPQGREWSCASCHGITPTQTGRHANTGKPIAPLAPAFNPARFIDPAKTEKWFRRNCNDVLARECTAAEKADVLSWLISIKP